MEKVTAIIPCYNEEKNIERAIQSVKWADEIMVVDSYSTDKTLEIAKKHTSFTLQHEYENSAAQKNWAIPQANHPWIFLLDADEVVTPELQSEVKSILQKNTPHDAFWIKRQNYFMGKKLKYSWSGDKVIRLFKRDTCKYQPLHVHAEIITEGSISQLKNKIEHHSYEYKSLERHLKRMDIYTTWGAYDRVEKVGKVTMFHLFLKPFWRFIRHYFIQLGMLDGKVGFVIAVMSSYTVFLRSLKLWRIKEGEVFTKDIRK